MKDQLIKALKQAIEKQGIESPIIHLEHPEDISFGDFSSNVALIYAKQLKVNPKILAEKIVEEINKIVTRNGSENFLAHSEAFETKSYYDRKIPSPILLKSIEIAGAGFINIKLKDSYFTNEIKNLLKEEGNIGKNNLDKGKKIMVEYTDPNPFKIFHIGHLMANTVGESISRIVEFSNAHVIRVCYQGDVGLHVAKTLWAVQKNSDAEMTIKYLGDMYVIGNEKYETDELAKKEIIEINKKIFDKSDKNLNKIYDLGRKLSLEYFDTIYRKLGTKFNEFFFESEVVEGGVKIVKEFLAKKDYNGELNDKKVFEESDGAVVFKGEKYGEHTRVFINSQGLPTYEAKELGLIKKKFEKYPDLSESITITANEQDAYFKVISALLKIIYPDIASKTRHISHGILRPSSGKMSSRKGNIVSAEVLLEEFESLVENKIKDRDFNKKEQEEIKKEVAVAGLKYMILRQSIGGDIIYDPEKALSFEGDSGPYLQYATVRANAILKKAEEVKDIILPEKVELLEKLLIRFPEIIERARLEYAPSHIATYLIELASEFNSYYSRNQIIDEKNPLSPYRISLTKLFANIIKNGLWLLGIEVPGRM